VDLSDISEALVIELLSGTLCKEMRNGYDE